LPYINNITKKIIIWHTISTSFPYLSGQVCLCELCKKTKTEYRKVLGFRWWKRVDSSFAREFACLRKPSHL